MDDKTMVNSQSSMVCCLLHKLSTLCLLLDQRAFGREFQFHFDLLETTVIADQSFTDDVESAVVFIFQAEVVVQVDAALDNLATAIAFYIKGIVTFLGFGRGSAKKILEEAHVILSVIASP